MRINLIEKSDYKFFEIDYYVSIRIKKNDSDIFHFNLLNALFCYFKRIHN